MLAMFFLGRSIGAIAYGLRMQRGKKDPGDGGDCIREHGSVIFSRKLGIGIRERKERSPPARHLRKN